MLFNPHPEKTQKMTLPLNFNFSQGSLQNFVECPRRFQLKYIDKLAWPALKAEPALESENHMQQGAAFHRLVQQYLLGVSIEKLTLLAKSDPNLARWWSNFLSSLDFLEGLTNISGSKRFPEIDLNAPIGEYRLVGKFDLLLIADEQFIIYDWKTARTYPKRDWVELSLQTRVYPYLLKQAGTHLNNGIPINSSQIKMVYWYANFPTAPLEINFSEDQFKQDQSYIFDLVEEISLLEETPAQMTENVKRCQYCTYRSLCDRGTKAGLFDEIDNDEDQDLSEFDLDFEQIAEIEYF